MVDFAVHAGPFIDADIKVLAASVDSVEQTAELKAGLRVGFPMYAELDAFAVAPGKALRDAANGAKPVAKAPLWKGKDDRELRARDLDGDGRVDFITVVDGATSFQVQLFVRK